MKIRRAKEKDIPYLNKLLFQVCDLHSKGRPDLFRQNAKKYTDKELKEKLNGTSNYIFVAELDKQVVAYCFCEKHNRGGNIFYDKPSLYIDDLCVDENCRGQKIGEKLFKFVQNFAKENGFYDITLNVWSLNGGATKFYQKMGLLPLKMVMEKIL